MARIDFSFRPPLLILLQDFHQVVRGFLGVHDRKFGNCGPFEFGIFFASRDGHDRRRIILDKISV
jgi:hypothetical protein